jgi:hypothetical protein
MVSGKRFKMSYLMKIDNKVNRLGFGRYGCELCQDSGIR